MQKHQELIYQMMNPHFEELEQLMLPNADFSSVNYKAQNDPVYGTSDKNYTNRYAIACAIYFKNNDLNQIYENVIRHLLIEEIKDRSTNSFQGIGDSLNILAFLLKRYHIESDKALFINAKEANFDTSCGLNLNDLQITMLKQNIEDMTIDDGIYLAANLKKQKTLSLLIDTWKIEQTNWDTNTLNRLRYFEKNRNNDEGELFALNELAKLAQLKDDWDYCNAMQQFIRKQIEINYYSEALLNINQVKPRMLAINEWYNIGLGRFIIEDCMDIIIALNNDEKINELWQWTSRYVTKIKQMPWNLYQKASDAALKMGDIEVSNNLLNRFQEKNKR